MIDTKTEARTDWVGGLLTTGFEDAGCSGPETSHIEPVRSIRRGNQVDAVSFDGRREVRSEFFGTRDFVTNVIGLRLRLRWMLLLRTKRACRTDHALRGVQADGVGEVQCQLTGGVARTAADIEHCVEVTARRGVMVDDGLIDFGVVVAAQLGVSLALRRGVGAECLFL